MSSYEFSDEYLVRRAAVTALGTLRAQDHQTPLVVLKFLEGLLASESEAAGGSRGGGGGRGRGRGLGGEVEFDPSICIANSILSPSYINIRYIFTEVEDPVTKAVTRGLNVNHPIDEILKIVMSRLEWEVWKGGGANANANAVGGSASTAGVVSSACVWTGWRLGLLRVVDRSPQPSQQPTQLDKAGSLSVYKSLFLQAAHQGGIGGDRVAGASAQGVLACVSFGVGYGGSPALGIVENIEFLLRVALEQPRQGCGAEGGAEGGAKGHSNNNNNNNNNNTVSNRLRQTIIELCLDAVTGKDGVLNR